MERSGHVQVLKGGRSGGGKAERREGERRQQHCTLQRYNCQTFREVLGKNREREITVEIQGKASPCRVSEKAN